MIASFEGGRALLDACRKELDSIRLRIEKVTAAGAVEEVKIVANAQGESDVDL
jgi:exonuclease VII small subunit